MQSIYTYIAVCVPYFHWIWKALRGKCGACLEYFQVNLISGKIVIERTEKCIRQCSVRMLNRGICYGTLEFNTLSLSFRVYRRSIHDVAVQHRNSIHITLYSGGVVHQYVNTSLLVFVRGEGYANDSSCVCFFFSFFPCVSRLLSIQAMDSMHRSFGFHSRDKHNIYRHYHYSV